MTNYTDERGRKNRQFYTILGIVEAQKLVFRRQIKEGWSHEARQKYFIKNEANVYKI